MFAAYIIVTVLAAAANVFPSFRISGWVRFDPDEVASWLEEKRARCAIPPSVGSPRVAA